MASTGGSDGDSKGEPSSSSSRSSSSFTSRASTRSVGSTEITEPTSVTIQVLQEITDNFSEERALGQGSYGKVYKGVYVNGEAIAVKLLYNNMQTIDDKQFQHEFDNLMMLNHPNIVRLVGYCYETQRQHMDFQGRIVFGETTYKALCFEYMHMGSLRRHLSDEVSGLDWQTRYKIIRGTCEGLKYLHKGFKQAIYHLDLKPDNILLDENMVAKLADFGLSKLFDEEQTKVTQSTLGTIGYLPPEYLFGHVVSNKLDIFSLGVVMTQIIAGPKGHTRCAEMAYQEFHDQVHENWSNRLEKTCTSSLILEAYCEQVSICTEIGVRCMELDRQKRPSIVDIVDRLDETEAMIDKVVESWNKRFEKSQSDVELKKVQVCAEIGTNCIDSNPAKRPDADHIISRLDDTQSLDMETSVTASRKSCITLEEDEDKIFDMQMTDEIVEETLKAAVYGPADEMTTSPKIISGTGHGSHHSIDLRQKKPSLLSTKQPTENAWNQMYNHLRSVLRENNHVQAILNLSYYDLPGDLRNCFLYCSLFAEDHPMPRESLVRLWVAEGFVMKKDNSTAEEVADGNLMELIGRNMLEVVEIDELSRVSICKMHAIVRDLALDIAEEERFGSASDQGGIMLMNKEVRRLSTCSLRHSSKRAVTGVEFPRLRTFVSIASSTNMLSSILSGSSYLTVLELQDSAINQVPASIGNLFNLRYIGLRRTNVQSLPDTIDKLSNLETLDVKQTKIEKLPPGIVKVEKLRHLFADRFADESQTEFRYFVGVEAPKTISNFQELQTLETVHASKDLSLQLKKMSKLQNVWIDNISASNCEELFIALSNMPELSSILLCACDEKEIFSFQALKPISKRFHRLIVRGGWSDGTLKCPIFQGHGRNLKYLDLSWCNLRTEDPLQLLASHVPALTYLSLNRVSSAGILVLSAGCFSQLRTLVLKRMPNVKQLVIEEDAIPFIDGIYIVSLHEMNMVPHGIESLGSLKKLWLLDLHKDFKADWTLSQMHDKMMHVPELRT